MLRPPPLACDCHIHVFGPFARYPLDPARKYTPGEATLEEYLKVARTLGTGRVVLVQPSVYGTDSSCQLDALRQLGERARGVAVIDEATSDAQLLELNGAGFEGARLNLTREADLGSLERLAARELTKRNPERLVWGTDWPHPDVAVLPEDQALLDVLENWVPDEAMRHRILVDNPAKLYGF
ncbi:MAG TPA: amidohydrolase family protein [Burkholderiales bacterium]|nr:amidohydrolase family protein [Burkholderiales bacterium]